MSSIAATMDGGFLAGVLIGYALKKVVKIAAVVVGLFFATIAYLQYQQMIDIKWAKLQSVSQNVLTTLANATTQIPGFNTGRHAGTLAMTNLGIPLTGITSLCNQNYKVRKQCRQG
jgi:uncharacterized membrane protein (Fun14 family)